MDRKTVIAGVFALALSAPPAAAQIFAYTSIPTRNDAQAEQSYEKFSAYLGAALGVPVRYVPVQSYAAAVAMFRNNVVQLAWFGGLTGAQARSAVPGSEALAQGEEDRNFVTYFIAHKSAGVAPSAEFPKGIAGKSFLFGESNSTSGRLMPEFHIRRTFGKAPEDVFSRVGFSTSHAKTAALVASGAYQVGAISFDVFDAEAKHGRIAAGEAVVIWKTPPYPDFNWTIRGDVDRNFGAGFKEKVRKALFAMNDPLLLAVFMRNRFVPATNGDYKPILDAAREIGLMD